MQTSGYPADRPDPPPCLERAHRLLDQDYVFVLIRLMDDGADAKLTWSSTRLGDLKPEAWAYALHPDWQVRAQFVLGGVLRMPAP